MKMDPPTDIDIETVDSMEGVDDFTGSPATIITDTIKAE